MLRSLMMFFLLGLSSSTFAVDTVTVPASPFLMGCSVNDPDCEKDEGPASVTSVSVPAFRIDKHEVSVDDFRACIKAGMCTRPKDHPAQVQSVEF